MNGLKSGYNGTIHALDYMCVLDEKIHGIFGVILDKVQSKLKYFSKSDTNWPPLASQ